MDGTLGGVSTYLRSAGMIKQWLMQGMERGAREGGLGQKFVSWKTGLEFFIFIFVRRKMFLFCWTQLLVGLEKKDNLCHGKDERCLEKVGLVFFFHLSWMRIKDVWGVSTYLRSAGTIKAWLSRPWKRVQVWGRRGEIGRAHV